MADKTYKASSHYVWRLTDTLGQGAFGSVFKGIHKVTGSPVAVKVFKQNYVTVTQKLREFEILQKLNHPNVVKLLAIQEEIIATTRSLNEEKIVGGSSVMIMELCEAGSLYSTLDKPENSFGLSENEFLLVLRDITAGVKYLRQNDIIHRDYKPGNILKAFDADGNVHYKLCDFGAARILRDGEQHMSIVGTEEYLRDDIHKKAFFNGSRLSFPPTSDLWSLGATLFQLATGQLPFRPFNGRSDKEKMQRIVSQKPPGAICGFQMPKEDGEIIYEKKLRKECRFSSGLRVLVEKLLAGLLKNASETSWTFDEYFQAVEDILNRRRIEIFSIYDAMGFSVYLPQNITFPLDKLKEEIKLQTKMDSLQQVLLTFDGRLMTDSIVNSIINGRSVGQLNDNEIMTPDVCLFVPNSIKSQTDVVKSFQQRRLPYEPKFNNVASMEEDCDVAKQCAMLTCWISRELEKVVMSTSCLRNGITALKLLIEQKNSLCEEKVKSAKIWWSLLQRNLSLLSNCCSLQISTTSEQSQKLVELNKTIGKKVDSGTEICSLLDQIENDLTTLKEYVFTGSQQYCLAQEDIPHLTNNVTVNELELMKLQTSATQEIWNVFKRDKAMHIQQDETRYFHEIHWHKLLKKQLIMRWELIQPRYNGESLQILLKTYENFKKCHESYLSCLRLEFHLEEKMEMLQEILAAFDISLNQTSENYQQCVATGFSAEKLPPVKEAESKPITNESTSIKASKGSNVQLANGLLDVMQMAKELRELIEQNVRLSERLQSISFD